jgi:hypothetical protein
MIAAVKWPLAAFSALLLTLSWSAGAADDLNAAARELARKTAAFAGRGEPVSLAWRNLSSLTPAESANARAAFEASLKSAGGRVSEVAPLVETRITISQNQSQFLLVEEARRGDDRQVWIAEWLRAPAEAAAPRATLEKKLVWEQEEQMLDVSFPGGRMLVLTPSHLAWFSREEGQWTRTMTLPLPVSRNWPRDLRGRLRVNGAQYQAYLPGLTCSGTWETPPSLECNPAGDPWVLESGSRAMLLAAFAAGRNYFDGRVTTQTGARKTVAPFYSAASFEESGKPLWLLAMLDGRTLLFDASFEPAGEVNTWGSDIAGTEARCGAGSQVLAATPGEGDRDAIQAFTMENRAPVPLTLPVEFPGPVTALWTSGGASALAVSKNSGTGRYEAYQLTVVCGR